MNKSLTMKRVLSAVFMILSSLCITEAFGSLDSYNVVLTGTVLESDHKGGPKIFELWIPEKKWLFKVTDVRVSGRGTVNGWMLLSRISPPRIKLAGDEELFYPLTQSNTTGKSFRLVGRLFLRHKTLNLSLVEEVTKEASSSESE